MKRLALAAMLTTGTIPSASATEVWQGDLFITAANATCVNSGFSVNDFFRSVYRPNGLEDNGPDARLTLISARVAQRYSVTGALSAGKKLKAYSGQIIYSTAGFASWDGTYKLATVTPATPTVNTATVTIAVTFNDFASFVGCTATLKGSLGNRPNL